MYLISMDGARLSITSTKYTLLDPSCSLNLLRLSCSNFGARVLIGIVNFCNLCLNKESFTPWSKGHDRVSEKVRKHLGCLKFKHTFNLQPGACQQTTTIAVGKTFTQSFPVTNRWDKNAASFLLSISALFWHSFNIFWQSAHHMFKICILIIQIKTPSTGLIFLVCSV